MFKREHHDGIYMVLPYFISVMIPNVSNKDYFLKLDEGIQTRYKLSIFLVKKDRTIFSSEYDNLYTIRNDRRVDAISVVLKTKESPY